MIQKLPRFFNNQGIFLQISIVYQQNINTYILNHTLYHRLILINNCLGMIYIHIYFITKFFQGYMTNIQFNLIILCIQIFQVKLYNCIYSLDLINLLNFFPQSFFRLQEKQVDLPKQSCFFIIKCNFNFLYFKILKI